MTRRTLHLLRHAKSSWDDPGLSDRERPLAGRGEKASARMARHMEAVGVRPSLVICSPAVRTRQTLTAVERALPDGVEVRFDDGLYGAGVTDLIRLVRSVPAAVEELMLIGHNPGLQDLALTLVGAGDGAEIDRLGQKLPTGALVTLSFGVPWSRVSAGVARLESFVAPRQLPRR
ncbi:MAG TPA: histidine phosphatase family protein [Acidimicrobiales bacterium]|nr:histidine phosphatase family protein [Acidimicrobiales bacterium]